MQANLNPNSVRVFFFSCVFWHSKSKSRYHYGCNTYEYLTSKKKFKQKRCAAKTNKIPTIMKIYIVIPWKIAYLEKYNTGEKDR